MRRWLLVALGVGLAGAVLIWASTSGSESSETPPKLVREIRKTAVSRSAVDNTALRHPSMINRVNDLSAAVRRRRNEVDECVGLLRVHDVEAPDEIELVARYETRDDGRFDVSVASRGVTDVTFDRCLNAALEGLSLTSDAEDGLTLDVSSPAP